MKVTEEERKRILSMVYAQAKEVVHVEDRVTCGGCGRKVMLKWAYKCLYCGIYFCLNCARVHFKKD